MSSLVPYISSPMTTLNEYPPGHVPRRAHEGVKVQVNHPSSGCHTVRRVDADLVALIWVKIHPLDFSTEIKS